MEQTTLSSQNSSDIDNLEVNANTRRLFTAYYTLPYTSTGDRRALLIETSMFEPDGLFIGIEKCDGSLFKIGVHLNTEQLAHLVQVVSVNCQIPDTAFAQLEKNYEQVIDERNTYENEYNKLDAEFHDAQVKIANLEEENNIFINTIKENLTIINDLKNTINELRNRLPENNRPANRQIADLKEIIKTLLEY